eukprot:TRINITY_DN35496_c0_g1_i1.p1 TRINITY_DN35496_c0_g1~~TRINITY_DN35496_c0_g1_i1.p1  ORF type:complete len:358 (+),score=63.28 TRINITY_DN35496_c0_g1_i1:162-1235(+)
MRKAFSARATAVLYGAILLERPGCSQAGPARMSVPLNWRGQLMEVSQAPNETSQAGAFNRMSRASSETSRTAAINTSAGSGVSSDLGAANGSSESAPDSAVAVSSWIVMTLAARNPAPGKDEKRLNTLADAIRTALAETLNLCRASVHVTEMSTKDADSTVFELLETHWMRPSWRKHMWHDRFHRTEPVWDSHNLAKMASLMRKASNIGIDDFTLLNFTHLKASYEIRIFPDMRVPAEDMTSRIDRLQLFGRFADLNHVLVRNIVHGRSEALAEAVMLDDVGFAARDDKARFPLSAAQLADCIEDGLLQDARAMHQYIIAFSCILVLLISCASSAIFSLKQPSLVPSRANPLLSYTR